MDDEDQIEAMTYTAKEPPVKELQKAYTTCLSDLEPFFQICERSYRDRRNLWPGKSSDFRKHGANAFPWEGASDMEVNTIGERIDSYVAILLQALDRSHIKAFPTSIATMSKASVVSGFLKWMRSTYIPDFRRQMELGANNLLEKGIMVSHVGWNSESRTFKQVIFLDQIEEEFPDVAAMIANSDTEDEAIQAMSDMFDGVSEKRIKRAVKELRKTGKAEIPMSRQSVNNPIVCNLSPDSQVFFPPFTNDPQRAPYVFYKTYYTPQELEKKVTTDGWDADWVEEAIENWRGKEIDDSNSDRPQAYDRLHQATKNDLICVIYAYQRLIDEEDGSEGIYYTVLHPIADGYAKHELLNGHDEYPFIVTRLNDDQEELYETRNFSDILRGAQKQIKTERDSRIDRASLATNPTLMHPAGRPPSKWGPNVKVPYRRPGEIMFGPTPPLDPGSERIEAQMVDQANRAVGLDIENPISGLRQQFIVNKFLDHVKKCLDMAFRLFQRVGPDEVFFIVTGNPNPQTMGKGSPDDRFTITVSFDSRETDPENAKTQLETMVSALQLDTNGRVDRDKLLELVYGAINPAVADYILMPDEESANKVMRDITDDLAKIFAGIEVPARPNGASAALQIIQQYAQQPDVAQRIQSDESFSARLEKYAQQYQFQIQQAQNAEIGKLGTNPAQMGQVTTQFMDQ